MNRYMRIIIVWPLLIAQHSLMICSDRALKEEQATHYLAIAHPYKLNTIAALTGYLPARLNALVKYFNQNGFEATGTWIEQDPDLDSFLFILDAEKPYRLLAYSRTPAFTNKTPQELQQLLAPNCKTQACSIEDSFSQIIFIASLKITTYTAYWWPHDTNKLDHYISYATMVSENDKQLVIGVTMPYPRAEIQFILPHRSSQVLERIKKEGFEKVGLTIGKNDEFAKNALIPGKHVDYDYFFIEDFDYPNRLITHRTPSWVGMTPPETKDAYDPGCTSRECDVVYISKQIMATARAFQDGFVVYLWRDKPTSPSSLKIEYVKTIRHNRKRYELSSGLSANIPGAHAEEIMKYIDQSIDLIKEIGLTNAISSFKKSNTPKRYIFISNIKPPYKFLLHMNPDLNDKMSAQVQAYLNAHGKSAINMDLVFRKISHAARNGDGFVAYEWFENVLDPDSALILKVAYTKLFIVDGVDYAITAGIPIDQSQAAINDASNQASSPGEPR